MSGFLVQWNLSRLEMIVSTQMHKKYKVKKYHPEKFSKTTGIEIQIQHWVENR